jgi:hypothetical protein
MQKRKAEDLLQYMIGGIAQSSWRVTASVNFNLMLGYFRHYLEGLRAIELTRVPAYIDCNWVIALYVLEVVMQELLGEGRHSRVKVNGNGGLG